MAADGDEFSVHEHDWHSQAYVDEWISRDVQGDTPRAQLFDQMMREIDRPEESPLDLLDVGCGYGFVTAAAFRRFPRTRATLIDYSEPMLGHARQRLAAQGDHVTFQKADLTSPDWSRHIGGPFDAVVSASVIHNFQDEAVFAAVYRAIGDLTRPGGSFLNCDLFDVAGGLELHRQLLKDAGFGTVRLTWHEAPFGILAADKA